MIHRRERVCDAESIAEELRDGGAARVRGCGIIQYSRHKWRAPRNEHMRFCQKVNPARTWPRGGREVPPLFALPPPPSPLPPILLHTAKLVNYTNAVRAHLDTRLADANTRASAAPLCCASISDKGGFHLPIPTVDCLDQLFLSGPLRSAHVY